MAALGVFTLALVLVQASSVGAAYQSAGCGRIDMNVDYQAGDSLKQVPNVQKASRCCELCNAEPRCKSWTWGLQYPDDERNTMCYMKTKAPTEEQKVKSIGVFSGLPHRGDGKDQDSDSADEADDKAADKATTTAAAATTSKAAESATKEGDHDGACGKMEPAMDYKSGRDLSRKYNVDSPEGCCEACWEVPQCKAWTWGYLLPHDKKPSVCYMKSASPQPGQKQSTKGTDNEGIVSGLPGKRKVSASIGLMEQCGGRNWNGDGKCGKGLVCVFVNEWYSQCHQDPSKPAAVQAPVVQPSPAHDTSLFCFSLVTPGTTEPDLMVQQWKLNAGLFACDSYTIISNTTAAALFPDQVMASKVEPHVGVIQAQLWSPLGQGPNGHWHALNTPVFIKAWAEIVRRGQYKKYDWTVKLDVDAVIAPPRVKALLRDRPRESGRYAPVYLQNAGTDATGNFLHGPVEVLSQAAVEAFGNGAERCKREVDYSREGEDYYLNFCLQLLRVPGVKEMRLLQDAYMWGQKQVECTTDQAVFHPCKTTDRWMSCVKQIGQDALASVPKVQQGVALVMKYDDAELKPLAQRPGPGPWAAGAAAAGTAAAGAAAAATLVGLVAAAAVAEARRRAAPRRSPTGALEEGLGKECGSLLE